MATMASEFQVEEVLASSGAVDALPLLRSFCGEKEKRQSSENGWNRLLRISDPSAESSDDTFGNPGGHCINGASCTGNEIPFMLTAGKDHPECGG